MISLLKSLCDFSVVVKARPWQDIFEDVRIIMKKFKIIEHIGEISAETINGKVWRKELNLVSWNNNPAKYEIRKWNPGRTEHGDGGIVFTYDEGIKLCSLLSNDYKNRTLLKDSLNNKILIEFPRTKNTDIQAFLVERIGIFSEGNDVVRKEVNLMCWGDLEVKYDLRKWNDTNSPYFRRGIRLSKSEAVVLVRLIEGINSGNGGKANITLQGNDRCYYFLAGKVWCALNDKRCVGYKICPNFKDLANMKPLPVSPSKPKPTHPYQEGTRVKHKKFGVGCINRLNIKGVFVIFENGARMELDLKTVLEGKILEILSKCE